MSLHLHMVCSISQELLSGIGTTLKVNLVITGASNLVEDLVNLHTYGHYLST
jgi:hypothetical protein